MTFEEYMEEHHHASETGIGLARYHLINDKPELALKALDEAAHKIDQAFEWRKNTKLSELNTQTTSKESQ